MTRYAWAAGAVAAALVAGAGGAPAQMSAFEADVIIEMNLARTDPAGYAAHLESMLRHFDGRVLRLPGAIALQTSEGAGAVREAIRALRNAAPMEPLTPSEGLGRAARDHATDQGPRAGMGHRGSDGSSMADRVSRYGEWGGSIAENIAYGSDTPRAVVIDLLVDDGVPSRGHRHNILNRDSRFAGVGCAPHGEYRIMCVIDFAGTYRETTAGARR